MQSPALLTTLLIVLLWAPACIADISASDSQSRAATGVLEPTYGSPASEDSSIAGTIDADSEYSKILQTLSPLPVIGLGILGLFWIRRHTAEL